MRYYRDYMDRQQVNGALHDRLIGLEIPKGSGTKTGRWPKVAALAACCVLAVGLGMWQLGTLEGGQNGDFSGVVNTQGPDKIGTPGGNEESFLADSGVETDKLMMPNIVPVSYAGPEGRWKLPPDIALPEGAFTMELTEEQICLILWGSQEAMAQAHEKVKPGNVPWLLNWDGYSISGTATYAGTGELWQATLRGTSPEGGEFTITLAPGGLPLTCVVTVDDTGKVCWKAWRWRPDRSAMTGTATGRRSPSMKVPFWPMAWGCGPSSLPTGLAVSDLFTTGPSAGREAACP